MIDHHESCYCVFCASERFRGSLFDEEVQLHLTRQNLGLSREFVGYERDWQFFDPHDPDEHDLYMYTIIHDHD